MSRTRPANRRTGACPTMTGPTLQRDGMLVRIPLVGGCLTAEQARSIADVAEVHGSGVIELTNRASVQIRGVGADAIERVVDRLTGVGLGLADAQIVTVSSLADDATIARRDAVVAAVEAVGDELPAKWSVHLEPTDVPVGQRPADVFALLNGESSLFRIDGLDGWFSIPTSSLARLAVEVADMCARHPGTEPRRVRDVVVSVGAAAFTASLPADSSAASHRDPLLARRDDIGPLGVTPWGTIAAVPLGRPSIAILRGLAEIAAARDGRMHVTPWRSVRIPGIGTSAATTLARMSDLGLATSALDPSVGVIACIGADGCLQTELRTLPVAEQLIAYRPPGRVVHVSGCDKSCAFGGDADVTLVGRSDSSGFDSVGSRHQPDLEVAG